MATKQQGGWYQNPATGQSQRWWNGAFLPVGQVEPGTYLQNKGESQQQAQARNNGGAQAYQAPEDRTSALIQSFIDANTKALADYQKKSTDFDKANPFNVDQWLGEERAKVSQRLDPYYNQTLSDFTKGIDLKRQRGLEDSRTLLGEIQQDSATFTGNQKLQLTDAIDKSREGAADAGLYTSGAALRDQGRLEQQTGQNLSDALTTAQRKTDEIQKNQQRNTQDLTLEQSQKTRDINQEKYYQTESQAQTQLGQRENTYQYEKGQAVGAPPMVDPNNFSSYLNSAQLR